MPEDEMDAAFQSISFEDLVNVEKATFEMNKFIRLAINQRIEQGVIEISNDGMSCDGTPFQPSQFYRNEEEGIYKLCPHFHKVVVRDNIKSQVKLMIWEKCLRPITCSRLHDLTLEMPTQKKAYAEYSTRLHATGYPMLKNLCIKRSQEPIDLAELNSGNALEAVRFDQCNLNQIQWAKPPGVLQIDAGSQNADKIITLFGSGIVKRQIWNSPPTQLQTYIENNIASHDEFSVHNGYSHFYYKHAPLYVVKGNKLEWLKTMVGKLQAAAVANPSFQLKSKFDHFYLDMRQMTGSIEYVEFDTYVSSLDIDHLKLVTTDLDYFTEITSNYIKPGKYRIVEVELETDQKRDQYIYVDMQDQIADTNCYDLVKSMKLKHLSLAVVKYLTLDEQNELRAELDAFELEYLKLSLENKDFPMLNERFRAAGFSLTTHLCSSTMEIISKTHEKLECVEVVYGKMDAKTLLDNWLEAIIPTGKAYRIVFEATVKLDVLEHIVPNMAKFTNCKYLTVTGKDALFFKYFADNLNFLTKKFEEFDELTHLRFEIDEMDENLLSPLFVFPSVEYVVLVFSNKSKVLDSFVDRLLQNYNGKSSRKWHRIQWLENRTKRTFIFAKSILMSTIAEKRLKDFIKAPWSLKAESNKTMKLMKDTYPDIHV